jgi:glycosyltransferase involved in cell wall biosynthesis
MKILHIAPVWETVPPPAYGGTEAVVFQLVEELVRRGHDVTLWAAGDSTTTATLRWSSPRSLRTAEISDRGPHDWLHIAHALEDAATGDYDLIHNHAGELPLAFSRLVDKPVLSTMHYTATKDTLPIWNDAAGWYNTISHSQYALLPEFSRLKHAGTVYNGIDVQSFPFSSQKGDYLLFLSRMAEDKAPHIAIEVAHRLGKRLLMAGKVDWREHEYFERVVLPLIDGDQIQFLGEADSTLKRALYRDAIALLLPLQWDEPFGLVSIEAMACGTPVIAFPRGALPELVVHGETGFLVENVDEMAEATKRVSEISSAQCRARVTALFDCRRMVDAYELAYRRVIREGSQPDHLPAPRMSGLLIPGS